MHTTLSHTDVVQSAADAFVEYRKKSAEEKAGFLDQISEQILALGQELIQTACAESNLPEARITGERGRTIGQLKAFASMLREGSWVEASIDTAIPDRAPIPKPDIRKMLVPIGPVVVFGASNFPLAFSTAGGDTASAFAAGCTVVVKEHPAHPKTSKLVAGAIDKAIELTGMPKGIFQHVSGGFEIGEALVKHPHTAAVGFTGSTSGGRALYDMASSRQKPIPVFAEMGSINPVIILPGTMEQNATSLANAYAGSITLSVGQFCTNPGLLLCLEGPGLETLKEALTLEFSKQSKGKMLYGRVHEAFLKSREKVIGHAAVTMLHHSEESVGELEATPTLAQVSGSDFLKEHFLREEIFGPYALLVVCKNETELVTAWNSVSGQLTTSIMGTDEDLVTYANLVDDAIQIAGRINFNMVPTGVEVCPSMVHGGPYPATTDPRFTAVGLSAVKRWSRPVCFQNAPSHLLPAELKDKNDLKIWRLVNSEWTQRDI